MSKLRNFFLKCRKHPLRTNIGVILVTLIFAFLGWGISEWFFSGLAATFGSFHEYFFLCATIIIAIIAAVNSIFATLTATDSEIATQKSLELTRSVIRPFMTVTEYAEKPLQNDKGTTLPGIWFTLMNTGQLPAENIQTEIHIFQREEQDTHTKLQSRINALGTIFPSQKYNVAQIINPEYVGAFNEGKIIIHIGIFYSIGENTHITNQAYSIGEQPNSQTKRVISIIPEYQSWN